MGAEYEELDYDANEQFDDDDVDVGETEVQGEDSGFAGTGDGDDDDDSLSDPDGDGEGEAGPQGLANLAMFRVLLAKARGEITNEQAQEAVEAHEANAARRRSALGRSRKQEDGLDPLAKILEAAAAAKKKKSEDDAAADIERYFRYHNITISLETLVQARMVGSILRRKMPFQATSWKIATRVPVTQPELLCPIRRMDYTFLILGSISVRISKLLLPTLPLPRLTTTTLATTYKAVMTISTGQEVRHLAEYRTPKDFSTSPRTTTVEKFGR